MVARRRVLPLPGSTGSHHSFVALPKLVRRSAPDPTRLAAAAKDIKRLISDSTGKVGEGVRLVGATGQVLSRIMTEVIQINTLVAEIAMAAQEQSSGLPQVNAAVNQMDQLTQQLIGCLAAEAGNERGADNSTNAFR